MYIPQQQEDRAYYNFINSCKSEDTREKYYSKLGFRGFNLTFIIDMESLKNKTCLHKCGIDIYKSYKSKQTVG